jgi:hypothetical protein
MSTNAPFFIVGANRSGTTLLRLMLNAHSRIAVPDELVYFRTAFVGLSREEWSRPEMPADEYRAFVRAFLSRNREPLAPLSVEELEDEICASGPADLRRPYDHALSSWAAAHGKARWGEKTPGNLFYVDVIADMFPEARFIYVSRDPRAGVHSMMKTSFFRGDTVINALNRRKYDSWGLDHLRRSVKDHKWTLLRFEDLVRDPEGTLSTLCTFLGEDFEPAMLSYHEDAQKYMKERAVRRFNRAATQPVTASKAESWRSGLSDEQIAEVEWICGDAMDAFGYDRSGLPLPWANRVSGWVKTSYWFFQNWRHRHAPQFVLQDRIFQRLRTRLSSALGALSHLSTSTR